MSVFLETSKGEIVIDLFYKQAPRTCFNFVQMCQMKFYNDALFTFVQKDFIYKVEKLDPLSDKPKPIQESIWSLKGKQSKPYFEDEPWTKRFNKRGLVATANEGPNMNTSAFFIVLRQTGNEIREFKNKHTVFGEVVEGMEILEAINQVYTIGRDRPL